MSDFVLVLVSAALVNHLILHSGTPDRARLHLLGLCSALSMLLMVPAALVLRQPQLAGLQLLLALPLLALLAWGVPTALARLRPHWPVQNLAPLLLGNVAVLGLLLHLATSQSSPAATGAWALALGMGFWLALALFDDLRQRLDHPDMPRAFRGLPIELISAGVMAMAFSGLNGLFTQ
ncbi:Rnf-Nqr domain containing protein [Pseudomonas sp. MNR3A]|uniref:Rnf-Nqr domain containing protein n=1 Tax=Pseudomonas sp. MNR3A TaxID=2615213 RepID=UPI00129ADFE1|nr:Rnf-Nqr domain containing protein [Pseudomonas sp. MNR3A]